MSRVTHQFTIGNLCINGAVSVDRWADARNGTGSFLQGSLYPTAKRFTDPNTVGKIEYKQEPEYTIQRRILPHEIAMQDEFTRYFASEREYRLQDCLQQCNLLLLADAGQGKTMALRDLAYNLYNGAYFPFLFPLKEYTGKSIEELLPETYRDLPASQIVILFDGYDELRADAFQQFEANLNKYTQKNPAAHIIVCSRSNFCKTEQNNVSKTLSGFQIYDLCPLDHKDIENYLTQRGIEVDMFCAEAKTSNVIELCKNPFYLTRLADLFRQNKRLPQKAKLMDKLIEDSFEKDNQKFPGNLEENYVELFHSLERVAYAMQLLHTNSLDDRAEYQKIFELKERKLIKKSGLFEHVGTKWNFTHNNFREYLTARYLRRLSQEDAVRHFYSGNEIKPSWVNTLGYLTSMDLRWNLKDCLTRYAPNALVKFEPDRIDSSTKSDIFERMFCECEDKQLLLQDQLCTEADLARFGCSTRTLDFLLKRISNPVNEVSQYNAIRLLRYYPTLYGQKERVRETLLTVCERHSSVRPATCRLAILAIIDLKIFSPESTERLMTVFYNSENDYIRCGMYEYLLETKVQNQYVQFYLDGLPLTIEDRNTHNRLGNELFALERGLKQITSLESVTIALEWFTDHINIHFYKRGEIVAELCKAAENLYAKGDCTIYQIIFALFKEASRYYQQEYMDSMLQFFEHTCTLKNTVIEIANLGDEYRLGLDALLQRYLDAFSYIEQAYIDGHLQNKNVFARLVVFYIRDVERYSKYAKLIQIKENRLLPELQSPRDYESERKEAQYQYFNMLFDCGALEKAADKLIRLSKFDSPTVDQIADEYFEFERDSSLLSLQYAMQRYVPADTKVSDFCSVVSWGKFMLIEAEQVVRGDKVTLTDGQKMQLIQTIHVGVEETIEKAANSILMDAIIYFSVLFKINFKEEILLHMTEIYAFFFGDKDGSKEKYTYLEANLNPKQIKAKLVEDVKTRQLASTVLQDHIDYLTAHHCDDLIMEATEICRHEKNEVFLRSSALKYVYQYVGAEYVADEIVKYADGEFLIEIRNLCPTIPLNTIRSAMESQFAQVSSTHLLGYLITMESHTAVEYYVDFVIRENKIPMCDSEENSTEAIRTLKNSVFLPQLERLVQTIFTDGFIDGKFYTLSSSVAKALVNCGLAAPEAVKEILERQVHANKENDRCVRWCNYVLNDLDHALLRKEDMPEPLYAVIQIMQGQQS